MDKIDLSRFQLLLLLKLGRQYNAEAKQDLGVAPLLAGLVKRDRI